MNSKKQKNNLLNSQQINKKKLVLLWALIIIGYFMFVIQWYSISNFQGGPSNGGWGEAFFDKNPTAIVQSAPNWLITFGRAIGSFFAGYLIAKIGHKYAVCTVMSLMIISFPFIIVAQNSDWNIFSIKGGASVDPDSGVAIIGYSLFLIFRIFLAIGGTTLITYTNSIIAKMESAKKPTYMNINQLGFNLGALIANIFFVIPGLFAVVNNQIVWTSILSSFVVLIFITLICYLIFGVEMVSRETKKNIVNHNQLSFTSLSKEKDTWIFGATFAIWIIAAVFLNSGTMRQFIEQSPINFKNLAIENALDETVTNMKNSKWYWVWPAFVSLFVSGVFIAMFTLSKFAKTIYDRRHFCTFMFIMGYVCFMIAMLCGYFGGYNNLCALMFMLIFIFLSGYFIWGVQPILLTIPQQLQRTSPKYMGMIAGFIWGIGYLGYTIIEASLSLFISYVKPIEFNPSKIGQEIRNNKNFGNTWNSANHIYNELYNESNSNLIFKDYESIGSIVMIVLCWVVLCLIFYFIWKLPKSGYYNKNNEFILFTEKWNPFKISYYNMNNKKFLITTYSI